MKAIAITILLFTCAFAKAQVNLVRNPSFEDFSQCPDMFDQIAYAVFWSAIDSLGNADCTPEFCHACASAQYTSIPASGYYYQYPRTGNGMAQIQSFFDEIDISTYYRDYLLGRLNTALVDGQSYCVTFYVNHVELSRYCIDKIGAYFDDGGICNVNNCSGPLIQFNPQIEYTGGFITDSLNWTRWKAASQLQEQSGL
jgi:hypothetical protein